ncbi:hypothetical protein ACFY1A_11920 [Streptomyces sp. NPDC001520]|uniref:hypothetical protein n=1 Tax=Streptomyces sp. NPDC001520 TaxID=3364581 RepID=UPI003692BBB0
MKNAIPRGSWLEADDFRALVKEIAPLRLGGWVGGCEFREQFVFFLAHVGGDLEFQLRDRVVEPRVVDAQVFEVLSMASALV